MASPERKYPIANLRPRRKIQYKDEPTPPGEDELTDYEPPRPAKRRKVIHLPQTSVTLKRHHLGIVTDLEVGTVISIGDTVELDGRSFLKITELTTPEDGSSVQFDGDLFRPVKEFRDYLPLEFSDSEVVWLCEAKEDAPKPQGYWRTATSKDVLRIRHLDLTSSDPASESSSQLEATGMSTDKKPLFCRWKLVAELSNSKPKGEAKSFRSMNTGSIMLPKAFIALSSEKLSVGPPAPSTESEGSSVQKTYTFADAFCGAGGMSQGAKDAGFQLAWAFDKWADAVETYCANHGQGVAFQLSAEDFELEVSRRPERDTVDSKKCMTYVARIVGKVKPRMVTFEEVPNLLKNPEHRVYFTTMVRDLTSLGYSVRWKVIECADFGVPQKRSRLFLIASGPGERLPEFPTPTHEQKYQCQELGLKPWNSFGEAIDNLEANAPNHLIAHPRRVRNKRTRKPQHRPDWPLEETITTGATWPLHYSGEFLCTLREGACLQALPRDYEFRGPFDAIKKQVANTVPPPAAKAILESVKRCLMQTDASRRS